MRLFFILCFCLLKVVSTNAQCSITLSYTPASCPTCCDGCVTVNVITGCPPYTISWYPSDPTFPVVCSACADTTYIASVTDNCACTSSDTITVTDATGINSSSINNDFNVYPNPSNGVYTLDFTTISNENIQLEVFNLLGERVYLQKAVAVFGKNQYHIDLSKVADGIYFANVQFKDNLIVAKIIKN